MPEKDVSDLMVKLSIEVNRPDAKTLKHLNRAEKYDYLAENTQRWRNTIIAWLREKGLIDQVAGIGEATAFNVLFMETSEEVARRLRTAPGVKRVSHVDNIGVELTRVQ